MSVRDSSGMGDNETLLVRTIVQALATGEPWADLYPGGENSQTAVEVYALMDAYASTISALLEVIRRRGLDVGEIAREAFLLEESDDWQNYDDGPGED